MNARRYKTIRAKRNAHTGAPQATLWGFRWRVMVKVYDTTGTPPGRCHRRVRFSVWALPASTHRATAFYRGVQLYYGKDADAALKKAQKAFGWKLYPAEDFPLWMARYWVGDFRPKTGETPR